MKRIDIFNEMTAVQARIKQILQQGLQSKYSLQLTPDEVYTLSRVHVNLEAMLKNMDMAYGTVSFGGEVYFLMGDPAATNRVFSGWYGDVEDGEHYTAEWSSQAEDKDGGKVTVVWQFNIVKGGEPEDDGELPLDDYHIATVTPR